MCGAGAALEECLPSGTGGKVGLQGNAGAQHMALAREVGSVGTGPCRFLARWAGGGEEKGFF